jgi:uncharacterized coiled-coil DUF342 family protein
MGNRYLLVMGIKVDHILTGDYIQHLLTKDIKLSAADFDDVCEDIVTDKTQKSQSIMSKVHAKYKKKRKQYVKKARKAYDDASDEIKSLRADIKDYTGKLAKVDKKIDKYDRHIDSCKSKYKKVKNKYDSFFKMTISSGLTIGSPKGDFKSDTQEYLCDAMAVLSGKVDLA